MAALWLQAQFNVGDVTTQIFNTTLLYRIFVNRNAGVPPNGSVTLTIPFYTQILPATPANLGRVDDQFIDWWNAMRVYVFDGKDVRQCVRFIERKAQWRPRATRDGLCWDNRHVRVWSIPGFDELGDVMVFAQNVQKDLEISPSFADIFPPVQMFEHGGT